MLGAGWSRVTHPFATLYPAEAGLIVRLACVKHAASVHPEPGSNSPFKIKGTFLFLLVLSEICLIFNNLD